jgi:hypothetical protein
MVRQRLAILVLWGPTSSPSFRARGAEMSFEEFEDCFIWECDACGLKATFPPGDFWGAVAQLKTRRWEFERDEEGWGHKCGRCRKTGAQILAMPLSGKAKG